MKRDMGIFRPLEDQRVNGHASHFAIAPQSSAAATEVKEVTEMAYYPFVLIPIKIPWNESLSI